MGAKRPGVSRARVTCGAPTQRSRQRKHLCYVGLMTECTVCPQGQGAVQLFACQGHAAARVSRLAGRETQGMVWGVRRARVSLFFMRVCGSAKFHLKEPRAGQQLEHATVEPSRGFTMLSFKVPQCLYVLPLSHMMNIRVRMGTRIDSEKVFSRTANSLQCEYR